MVNVPTASQSHQQMVRKATNTDEITLAAGTRAYTVAEPNIRDQDGDVQLLKKEYGLTIDTDGVFDASHFDVKQAMTLGIIPDCELKYVKSVGNAAGDGAIKYLLNQSER